MGLLGVLRRGGRFFGRAASVGFQALVAGCRQVSWSTGGSEQDIRSELEVRFEITGTACWKRFKGSGRPSVPGFPMTAFRSEVILKSEAGGSFSGGSEQRRLMAGVIEHPLGPEGRGGAFAGHETIKVEAEDQPRRRRPAMPARPSRARAPGAGATVKPACTPGVPRPWFQVASRVEPVRSNSPS